MKNNSKLILLPMLLLGVAACTPNNSETQETPTTTQETSSDEQTTSEVVVNLSNAIKSLQSVDNYIIEEVENLKNPYKAIYHQDYSYDYRANLGYMNKNEAIYPFTIQNGIIVNKEKLESTSLYGDNGATINFDNIDASLITGVDSFITMKKVIALPLLDLCGYDSANYTKLNKIELSLIDHDINRVCIQFYIKELGGSGIQEKVNSFEVKQVGKAHDDAIETFIKSGEITFISEELIEIAELFKANNYTHLVYDDVTGEFIQGEMFNPSYYVRLYSDSLIAKEPIIAAEQIAHLEIFEPDRTLDLLKNKDGVAQPLIYDDTFHFVYDGSYETPGNLQIITRENPKRPGYAQGAFQEVIKSVEDAWNYPSKLKLFENLDEFIHVKNGNSFNTLSKVLIDDFLYNFNLTHAFDNYGGINELAINHNKQANEIVFTLFAVKGGYYQIYFGEFGETNFKPFDDLLASIKTM